MQIGPSPATRLARFPRPTSLDKIPLPSEAEGDLGKNAIHDTLGKYSVRSANTGTTSFSIVVSPASRNSGHVDFCRRTLENTPDTQNMQKRVASWQKAGAVLRTCEACAKGKKLS